MSERRWHWRPDGVLIDDDGQIVAYAEAVREGGDERIVVDDENARLIAAAPELLQWVKAYQDRMSDDEGELSALLYRIARGGAL